MQLRRGEEVLFTEVTLCNTFFARFRGLMFRPGLDPKQAFLFDRTDSIHSFNMRFIFDAVFMNKEGEILSMHSDIAPWRIIPPQKRAFWCLEMTQGRIRDLKLEVGQSLTWS